MIGWTPKPFIFIHIPKCAGTSIETALIPGVTGRNKLKQLSKKERNRYWLPGGRGLQHRKLRYVEKFVPLKDYFRFTVVRNPWDRAVSHIEYLTRIAKARMFASKPFKEKLRIYCSTRKHIWRHDLSVSQLDYLLDSNNVVNMDFIGKYESLVQDFNHVCSIIGIYPVPELPHILNAGRCLHYSEYYDEESMMWVKERFAKDVDFFDYHFETK